MFEINLKNKVALVTGVADNLGSNICLKLAKAGAEIWIHQFKEDEVKNLQEQIRSFGGRFHTVTSNFRNPEETKASVGKILEKSGRIDILVNQAEEPSHDSWSELTPEKWLQMFEFNMDVPFLCCQEVIPSMLQNGEGIIINISSQAAETGDIGAHYAATKSAVDSFTRGLSREYKNKGIKVRIITPPAQLHNQNQTTQQNQEMREAIANMTLLFCTSYIDYIGEEPIGLGLEVSSK